MFIIREVPGGNRVVFADILRVLAIFAVIVIHVSGSFSISSFSTTNLSNWWIENIFNSFSRWSVPIFFMVSGMLLLNPLKPETMSIFFKKRFNKVIIPFLVWGIVYEIIKPRYTGVDFSLKGMLVDFLSGSIYWHFWFFYAIIMVYILTPIIKSFTSQATKGLLIYTLSIWFAMTSILPIAEFLFKINLNSSTDISFIGSCVGYFVLGHFLHKYDLENRVKKTIYFLGVVSFISIPILTFYLTRKNGGNLNSYFYEYFSVTVVLMSVAIFLLSKSIDWVKLFGGTNSYVFRFFKNISDCSFGMFLIHFIVLNELARSNISVFQWHTNSIIRVPLLSVSIFLISFIIIYLLKKLPLIKKIVP